MIKFQMPPEELVQKCTGKTCYIYGESTIAGILEQRLNLLDISIAGILSPNSLESILYENTDTLSVIVAESTTVANRRAYHQLIALGLDFDKQIVFPFAQEGFEKSLILDVSLGYANPEYDIPGFFVYGDIDADVPRIITLGDYTRPGKFERPHSWPEQLHSLLLENGIQNTILCGGLSGYTSALELQKYIRDCVQMRHDILISFSGFNDFRYKLGYGLSEDILKIHQKHPFVHPYQIEIYETIRKNAGIGQQIVHYGLEDETPPPEYWADLQTNLYFIANEFNVKFFSFLQPSIFTGYNPTLAEKRRACDFLGIEIGKWEDCSAGFQAYYKGIGKIMKDCSFFTDLSNFFYQFSEIYLNTHHTNEEGNLPLAKYMFDCIFPLLQHRQQASSKDSGLNGYSRSSPVVQAEQSSYL